MNRNLAMFLSLVLAMFVVDTLVAQDSIDRRSALRPRSDTSKGIVAPGANLQRRTPRQADVPVRVPAGNQTANGIPHSHGPGNHVHDDQVFRGHGNHGVRYPVYGSGYGNGYPIQYGYPSQYGYSGPYYDQGYYGYGSYGYGVPIYGYGYGGYYGRGSITRGTPPSATPGSHYFGNPHASQYIPGTR
ncbi:hypothetical protein Poly51_56040 [Rubripirellula tenax]|uniref:Uncharacterized protein n=1 Tax=Rubripirellula tenax TaxID=2528015 RepID=A0A5C6EBE1_9BACT|nr:hypothetical protein [Rubripirellula tenax]TWU46208.1 hypothetical protein Poly51_56040 [Rubripirellula tenax]